MEPQPKSVNNFLGKIVTIAVIDDFEGCVNLYYTGKVVDILSQGVTVNPVPSEGEIIDHIPWSNIRAIRHTSHLEVDPTVSAATCEANVVTRA